MKTLVNLSQNKTAQRIQLFWKYFALVLTVTLVTSCSEFLKGKPKAQDTIEIQSASLGCLDNVSQDMSQFFKSEAGPEAVDKTVSCLTKTLTEFQRKVEGRQNADAFTAEEVYEIFTRFVSQAKLSRAAAQNMLLLKSAILGGRSDRITKAEINDLKNYLQLVREEAIKLAPYVKVFRFEKSNKAFSREFIEAAFAQIKASLKVLLNASKLSNSSYSFGDFKTLVVNVMNFADKEQNMVEILSKLNYVLNGYQDELTDTERDEYIGNITSLMKLFSLHQNTYLKIDLEHFDDLDSTMEFVWETLNLIENSLQYKKTKIISANSIDRLLIEVSKSELLPYKLRASSMINFYKALVVRLLESGSKGQVTQFTGIRPVHLVNLKRELAVYHVYGRLVTKTFAQLGLTGYHDLATLQAKMNELNPANEQDILSRFDGNSQYLVINVVNELRNEFLKSSPANMYYNKRMVLASNQNGYKQNRADLVQDMLVKMFSRFLMLGYGPQYQVMGTTQVKLNNVALYLWYSEFKALMIDLKRFDPRTFNAGVTSLTISNLFTINGNGDDMMTYTELNQYFGILLAGSGDVAAEMYNNLEEQHCQLPELDVFGKHWNIESCLDSLIQTKYTTYFAHLPHLIQYVETLSPTDFKKFFHDMMSVTRYSPATEGQRVESSDLSGMNTIAYFIENTYLVHDTNRNARLSESEIRAAYPKFKSVARDFAYSSSAAQIKEFNSWKGTIAGLGCFSEGELIKESFIFLVYNGRTPKTSDLNLFACFTGKNLISFRGEVDRMQLTQALKSLKSILAP